MIILYTFDYYKTRLVSANYLVTSIYSITQQFQNKNYRIIIYTTNVVELTNFLKNLLKSIKIDVRHYNPQAIQKNYYTVDWSRYPPNWNLIGHSRIYLIPYLLHQYREPILYLDCDTGVVSEQSYLYETLISCPQPFMNARELEQTIDIYGETQHFSHQLLDIKLYYHKMITTPAKTLYDVELQNHNYSVTMTTWNNGIMYFPANDISLHIACEILLVYEKLMEIYPYGFNDLNASSCVFEAHKELQCSSMVPYRVILNTAVEMHVDSHINYTPIDMTHYFTTSWLYYGQQSDHTAFENIIAVYRDVISQLSAKSPHKYQLKNSNNIDLVIGSPINPCENILEVLIFPKRLASIFHPQGQVTFVKIIRQRINQLLRIKRNSIILSYITFLLLIQPTIWNKLLNGQTIEALEWYDPTEQQLDLNQCGVGILEDLKTLLPNLVISDILGAISAISKLEPVNLFLQICQDQYPSKMLLCKDSVNYCPATETVLKYIKENNTEAMMRYLEQLDPNQLDETGLNYIHHSVVHNRPQILQLLLSRRTSVKPQVDTVTSDGETACHLAIKYSAMESLIILLRSNADCSIHNKDGQTPTMLATALNLIQFQQMLSTYEIKMKHRSKRRIR